MDNKGKKRALDCEKSTPPQAAIKKQKSTISINTVDMMENVRTAKEIMNNIKIFTDTCENAFHQYIRETISQLDNTLENKKKTTVGVFGKTGAGKSSLINAILGERFLLPSGSVRSCTSVIVQIEANVTDSNYIAEIEFISKKDWEDELKNLLSIIPDNENSEDITMAAQKIKALYGNEGASKTLENLKNYDNFSEIPEFLNSTLKTIRHENVLDFSEAIECYIKHDKSSPGGCYWPIVKSVTIKVPNCKDLLKHVVLVDLPGMGDCNKIRDQMWKTKLRDCSTVWIVSDIERAASDKLACEILKSITDMAQGGECSSMSFICTKTDQIITQSYMRSEKIKDEDLGITSKSTQNNERKTACILHRNKKAKEEVKMYFDSQHIIKKHFNYDDGFLSIFTVSYEEFMSETAILAKEQTEIPKLQDLLREYNNNAINEMGKQYILGALGILYLIQGSRDTSDDMRSELHKILKKNLHAELEAFKERNSHVSDTLENLLSEGTKMSERECVKTVTNVIKPKGDNRGFHQTLRALCRSDGYHRCKDGTKIDLNETLATHMKKSIDDVFNKLFLSRECVFPNSLQANIERFTIIKDDLMKTYKHSPMLSHMLNFLKIEENKLKSQLKSDLLKQKKEIYTSITESIKETMLPCYEEAALCNRKGSMVKQQDLLLKHIEKNKTEMFDNAKRCMLKLLDNTKNNYKDWLNDTLKMAIIYSLLNVNLVNMDVSEDLNKLKLLSGDLP